jgi:hypothetical protein
MHMSFVVGVEERHRVDFELGQLAGVLTIRVDGKPIIRRIHFISLGTTKKFRFVVGEIGRHDVRIEHVRKLLAVFRSQEVRGYVDGRLVEQIVGHFDAFNEGRPFG